MPLHIFVLLISTFLQQWQILKDHEPVSYSEATERLLLGKLHRQVRCENHSILKHVYAALIKVEFHSKAQCLATDTKPGSLAGHPSEAQTTWCPERPLGWP